MSDGLVKEWLQLKGWKELYITQKLAIDAGLLESEDNFVIIAPTASGKTGVAELAMLKALHSGQHIVYLVPLKALISEKEKNFAGFSKLCKIAGAGTPLKDWISAHIVITTFELFYRTMLTAPDIVKNFRLAIVDEFHILYDKLRGFNLEKVLTILKDSDLRIVCLSATFEDKKEIGEWLEANVVEVPQSARKIQIKPDIIDLAECVDKNCELCKILKTKSQSPYLAFCTTKDSTRTRALEMAKLLEKDDDLEKKLLEDFEKMLKRTQFTSMEQNLLDCLSRGTAFYHSGLHSKLRDFVERLYVNRIIDYLFATTGLAYGVNLPAKTVILCDLSFYNPNVAGSRDYIPTYMYIQMAGRAGRPGYETEGYSYVVAKNVAEREYWAPKIMKNKIERAVSRIGHDEYFRKAILELIYSGRNTDDEIRQFFEKTFYNFQSKKIQEPFLPFDLFEAIKGHIVYLNKQGLIIPMGVAGYQLTDFGKVVVGFLFWTFSNYEIEPFVELKKLLDRGGEVSPSFDVLYALSTLFGGARLSKVRRKTSPKIEEFYENLGVTEFGHPEYSAYAVFYGWMENKDEYEIESEFEVHSSQLPQIAYELYKLLEVYESLGRKMNYKINPKFKEFRERIREGVTAEELPFAKLKQIGRETARELSKYARTVLMGLSWKFKGPLLEVLKQLHRKVGDEEFLKVHIQYVPNVGEVKAKRILDFVKKSQEKL